MYFIKYCAKAFNYLGKIDSDNKFTQRAINWASDMPASIDMPSLLRKPAGLDGDVVVVVVVVVVDNMVVKFPAIYEKKLKASSQNIIFFLNDRKHGSLRYLQKKIS